MTSIASNGKERLSTQDGNFPTIIEPLNASSKAAIAVRDLTYLPLMKKFCILRFGRELTGFETYPETVMPSS